MPDTFYAVLVVQKKNVNRKAHEVCVNAGDLRETQAMSVRQFLLQHEPFKATPEPMGGIHPRGDCRPRPLIDDAHCSVWHSFFRRGDVGSQRSSSKEARR